MGALVSILSRSVMHDEAVVRRMLAASPHRGSEFVIRQHGLSLLGVSNTSDRAEAGISVDGPLVAAFTGSLDNAAELAKALADTPHPPVSERAADVVVSAFHAFGCDAPNRMRGMFAGVVTDGREMWCFRDHVGLLPLFYRDEGRGFFAATEAKQIIAGAELQCEPNLEVLEGILFGRMPSDFPCALKGVKRLAQATTLTVGVEARATFQRYWHPEAHLETLPLSPGEAAERFSELFGQAVARCLTGEDVVSLSGGIDSPAVAAFAAPLHRELVGKPISALTATFPDHASVDERPHVEMITEFLGIPLHLFTMQVPAFEGVKEWCRVLDGPVPILSMPETRQSFALARQLGFSNVLMGDFAESVLGTPQHLTGHLMVRGRWRALGNLVTTRRAQGVRWRRISQSFLRACVPGRVAHLYIRARGRDYPQAPDWVERCKLREVPYRPDLLHGARSRWSFLQLSAFEGSTVTMEALEVSAALAGVTVRQPFADVDLWEFFLGLRAEVKYPDLHSKTLIRKFLRGKLPDTILNRRDKTTFDEYVLSLVDYSTLREFFLAPRHHIPGIDYDRLRTRVEREDFTLVDWLWAKDLTYIHAFLNLWAADS